MADNLLLRKERDRIKDEYCKKEGMALIRIPYWEKDNMESFLCNKDVTEYIFLRIWL